MTKERDITIRPVRMTNEQYAELKRQAQLSDKSVAGYVERLIKESLKQAESNGR